MTRRVLETDPHRLAVLHPRRTSIVNHQRRNSQLRKASFTTSTLVCLRIERTSSLSAPSICENEQPLSLSISNRFLSRASERRTEVCFDVNGMLE